MAKINFTPDALEDMKEIKAYITDELCSEQSAIDTTQKIMKRIRQLADFPEIDAPLSSIISLEVPYRFLVCGNYTAFSRWGATWFTSSVYYTAAGTLCKYLSENHMMNNTRSLSFRVALFCHIGTISP